MITEEEFWNLEAGEHQHLTYEQYVDRWETNFNPNRLVCTLDCGVDRTITIRRLGNGKYELYDEDYDEVIAKFELYGYEGPSCHELWGVHRAVFEADNDDYLDYKHIVMSEDSDIVEKWPIHYNGNGYHGSFSWRNADLCPYGYLVMAAYQIDYKDKEDLMDIYDVLNDIKTGCDSMEDDWLEENHDYIYNRKAYDLQQRIDELEERIEELESEIAEKDERYDDAVDAMTHYSQHMGGSLTTKDLVECYIRQTRYNRQNKS